MVGGKPDSSASNSGESSGLRRSSRNSNNSSPGSVRKSPRLEKRGLETGTNSPVRRSGKASPSSKAKTVKAVSKEEEKEKEEEEEGEGEVGGMSLKENVKDNRPGSTSNVGEKRRKRMGARRFQAMFDLKNTRVSETKSKKRRLEGCFDNVDSGVGDSVEGMSEYCRIGVGIGNLKSEEGFKVNGDEGGDSGGNSDEGLRENCGGDVDGGVSETVEEPRECDDGAEMEKGCVADIDGGMEPCDLEGGVSGLVGEVKGSVVETVLNQDIQSASCRAGDNVDGSRCSKEVITIEAVVAGGEDTDNNLKVIPSVSPTCKMGSLNKECAKCSSKSRSDCDSRLREPCDCVSNSMSGANLISIPKVSCRYCHKYG